MRDCSKCNRNVSLTQFNRTKNRSRDGHRPWCKSCEREYNSAYRAANRLRLAEQKKLDKLRNRNRYREKDARRGPERRLYIRQYKLANPGKVNAACARRRAMRLKAIPKWFDREATLAIYIAAEKLRRAFPGLDLEVDHIVPICSALVCGLHVHSNLRMILASENGAKSNRYWPDMP